jgi:hypothetical protein
LLDPIEFERTGGFNGGEQSKIISIIRQHHSFLLGEWDKLYSCEETESDE